MAPAYGAFDLLARDYDREFSGTTIGKLMREAVRRRLAALFRPGQRLLELNCGTGEDAVYLGGRGIHVLATDASAEMVKMASAKVRGAGLARLVETRQMAIEELGALEGPLFDGALSNFGGLNCVDDVTAAARSLAARLRPGAAAVLVVMGPTVPWEWGWFLAHSQPGKAFRRLRPGGSHWRGMRVRYPPIGAMRAAFHPLFRTTRAAALGVFLPPPYTRDWAEEHPRLLRWLDGWERRLETVPPLPWLGDHYILEVERIRGCRAGAREGG